MKLTDVAEFVRESNRIEGIVREPKLAEVNATVAFVALATVTITDLVDLVRVYQPNARPRFKLGLDVRVGNHLPPRGGPGIHAALASLLDKVNARELTPFESHVAYETLHPFTDGNGRSGRALWLWAMNGYAPRLFLHEFYYQTLDAQRQ